MRWEVPVIGLVIGFMTWNTDFFQRNIFPVDYWTKEIREVEENIEFVQAELDDATKRGDAEMEVIFQEVIDSLKEELRSTRSHAQRDGVLL